MTFGDADLLMTPFAPLEGRKVLLRPFEPEDVTVEYVAWLNDPEVVRFSNQRFQRHDPESCAAYLATFARTENLFLAIVDRDDGRTIGTMTAYRNSRHGTVDVGIMVGDRRVWGNGFGLDAWMTLAVWLLGPGALRKLTCGTLACNSAMRSIAERSGMRLEATRHAQEIVAGEPQDVLYYARFRGDP